jgi:hypothetical protein
MACRGSGRVISNLGGTPESVTCPWCDGSGVRAPDIDAQARWLTEDANAQSDAAGDPGSEDARRGTPAPADAERGDSPDSAA